MHTPLHRTGLSLMSLLVVILCACALERAGTGTATEAPIPDALGRALDADDAGDSAIRIVHQHTIEPAIYEAYFAADLMPEPLATPDGGAFQFFSGSAGVGAIYSYAYATDVGTARVTSPVYGAILSAWGNWGFETLLGYPTSIEDDAADEPGAACRSEGGVRQQPFGYVGFTAADERPTSARALLCWSPERGVWALPRELAEGLRGERPLQRIDPRKNPLGT